MERSTGFARLGTDRIAYEVVGSGSVDLVLSSGSFGAFDTDWEDPQAELFLRRLASFSRLIRFDRRGTGGSDPLPLDALPPWESFVEELESVMAEVGSRRAAIMASYDAGPMGLLFAATKPERTTALILVNTSSKYVASDDYPIGIPPEVAEQLSSTMGERWGSGRHVELQVPSRADDVRFGEWYAKKTRMIAGPAAAEAYFRAMFVADARALLPAIHVPTLVLHRSDYRFIPVEHGRYLAQHISAASLVEIAGADGPLYWENADEAIGAVERFLLGVIPASPSAPTNRVLATVLTPTSSNRPNSSSAWATRGGGSCSTSTTRSRSASSSRTAAGSSRARATGYSRPSTARGGRSASRARSCTNCPGSGSRSGRASTPARWSCVATTWAGWPSTSRRGSWPKPALERSWSHGP